LEKKSCSDLIRTIKQLEKEREKERERKKERGGGNGDDKLNGVGKH